MRGRESEEGNEGGNGMNNEKVETEEEKKKVAVREKDGRGWKYMSHSFSREMDVPSEQWEK